MYGLFRAFYRDPEELSEILKESKNPEKVIIEIMKIDPINAPPDYDKWKIVEAILKNIPQNKRDNVLKEASNLPDMQQIIISRLFNAIIKEDISKRREDYNPEEDKGFTKKEIKKANTRKERFKD